MSIIVYLVDFDTIDLSIPKNNAGMVYEPSLHMLQLSSLPCLLIDASYFREVTSQHQTRWMNNLDVYSSIHTC